MTPYFCVVGVCPLFAMSLDLTLATVDTHESVSFDATTGSPSHAAYNKQLCLERSIITLKQV